MSTLISKLPLLGLKGGFHRFSVEKYNAMLSSGHLKSIERLQLIEGYLVMRMPSSAPHDFSVVRVDKTFRAVAPINVEVRIQCAIILEDSVPEPDAALVRGPDTRYKAEHPISADVLQVTEVSDSTLDGDRTDKVRIYSRAKIPFYWIINLVDRQIEVYSSPVQKGKSSDYAHRQVFLPGDTVPLILDGVTVATIPVAELLP